MAFSTDKTRQGAAGVSTGYTIDQSLRFNDDDSAYLSWTPSSAGNQRTYTWSGWVKRGELGSQNTFFGAGASGSMFDELCFSSADQLDWYTYQSATQGQRKSTAVFRDTSAWYHIVAVYDSTDSTALDRMKLYVNGEQITDLATTTNPDQNHQGNTNGAIIHAVGAVYAGSLYNPYDGYLAEVHFIDGTAYDADDFGEEGDYGEWKPKKVSGLTYGTNGFYLDFSDSAALGDDAANSNDFTVNNLTASDQVLDSPSNTFATWNPLHSKSNIVFEEGNLSAEIYHTGESIATSTINPSSGKWYFECVPVATNNNSQMCIGLSRTINYELGRGPGSSGDNSWNMYSDVGQIYYEGGTGLSLGSYDVDDIIQVAYNMDSGKVWWGKNGTWLGSTAGDPAAGTNSHHGTLSGSVGPACGTGHSGHTFILNAGQDSSFAGNKTAQGNQDSNEIGDFYYEPPTDYLALCTSNLPAVAVTPSEHFNTVLYTGDSGTDRAVTNVNFQPDWVWVKHRNHGTAHAHNLVDSVRGGTKLLYSSSTDAEETITNSIKTLDTDGFTLGDNDAVNDNSINYVAWCWKAGTSVSGTTTGSGTGKSYTGSVNADAGFSIIGYEGNGTNGHEIYHHLNEAPEMVIIKNRENTSGTNWGVYHYKLADTQGIKLNGSQGATTENWYQNTDPTSTIVELRGASTVNEDTKDHIAYCFHSVEGFSRCGKYEGNSSSNGSYVHLGFTPALIITKSADSGEPWVIHDNKRDPYNVASTYLLANSTTTEVGSPDSDYKLDLLSNGFKLRYNTGAMNQNTIIYYAVAERPFKHTNAK